MRTRLSPAPVRMMAVAILALLGVVTMPVIADEKKNPKDDKSYDEMVSVRRFANGKPATGSIDVGAFRVEKDGVLKFYTKAKSGSTPNKGAEITDKDGKVYVVEKVVEGVSLGYHISTVKLKAKD